MSITRRRTAIAGAVLLCALGISAPAWAGVKAQGVSGSQKIGSASWGAVGAGTTGSPVIGSAYTLTWAGLGATTQYFQIDNTGTLDLTGESYTATNSPTKILNGTAPTVTLTACVGADWASAAGTCGGTQVSLGTSAAGLTSTTVIATGGELSVRASTSATVTGFTTAISVSVARSQVRAGNTTNS